MQHQRLRPLRAFWAHPERIISLAALAVAFGALCVSLWQLDIARQHNVLSVRPYLMVTPHLAGSGGKNGLYLTNEGIGLGILTSLRVSISGRVYTGLGKNQWPQILRDMELDPLCFSIAWPTKTAALRPGIEIEILGMSKNQNPDCKIALAIFLARKDILIEVRYTSLYKEEYVFSGNGFMNL
ncbi:hypothetical protein LLY42_28635 [Pseudomonas frederiksbergensis]|nr:hypothetical protein LLY42_28635 [Pseudomonas frederiksbergensis]